MFRRLKDLMIVISLFASFAQAQSIPLKYLDSELKTPALDQSYFSAKSILTGDFVWIKQVEWKACHQRPEHRFFSEGNDPIEEFLETPNVLSSLKEMNEKKLNKAQVSQHPWSGDYWPYAGGLLGKRFQDPDFDRLTDWKTRYEYILANPASKVLTESGQTGAAFLSPSEKYDLIIGAQDFTQSMWAQGKEYFDRDGKVEGWMGICHGWAPAAIMEERPSKSVDVLSMDQKWKIHLTPSEIKGMVSYSWATNKFPSVILGNRCNEKQPHKDENGRITNPDCFDLNPGTWHIAIVNLIGLQDRSFVIDAAFDYEVWNQPVIGYSVTYYNPVSNEEFADFNQAQVQKSDYKKDPYAKYRSEKTDSIVGVQMKVGYVIESSANRAETDSVNEDLIRWVVYRYDLELNQLDQIIGGEWHLDVHPDFMWAPKKNVRPFSPNEVNLPSLDWRDSESVPSPWATAARLGSKSGRILNVITEELIKKANQ